MKSGFHCSRSRNGEWFFPFLSGSEWDYVIMSLVRSLKREEIDPEPSLSWLREHLGFLTDEHQMNVGLTRAHRGLCIIGEIDGLFLLLLLLFFFSYFTFYLIIENHFDE